jgi:hypothetical protein
VLNHVPTAVLGLVIIAVGVGIGLGLLAFVRRSRAGVEDNESIDILFAFIGAVYGIILAFVIVDLWTSFGAARDTVSTEAAALAQLEIDTRPLSPPDRARIENALSVYISAVVNDEATTMRSGRESLSAHNALDRLALSLERAQPVSKVQDVWYSEAVGKLNDVAVARRQRIEAAQRSVPMPFRVLIFTGALIPIGFMTLVSVKNRRLHTVMVCVVSALVAYAIFLVVALEYPFSGTVAVSLEPFRQGVLARLVR